MKQLFYKLQFIYCLINICVIKFIYGSDYMDNMQGKIKLLQNLNTDNSRFILKVLEAFEKNQIEVVNQKNKSSIITHITDNINKENIIDLDKIWSKPYFYTNMRIKFNKIIKHIRETSYEEISKNPKKFCNNVVNIKIIKNFNKHDDNIDIVEFIQNLNNNFENTEFIYLAKEIDEETLFKEDQIKKAIEIIKIKDKSKQVSYIYDEIYNYLDKDFISNKYCDFINNKCVAQRHHTLYPINRKNGCCFMYVSKCNHLLKNGSCSVQCLACRLFSCPYLSKKGIGYWAGDFVLLKAFLSKEQRKHLVFDFYEDKDVVLHKL